MKRSLPVPISGEAAATVGGKPWITGGLDAAGASADGVFELDPQTGAVHPVGTLAQPLHDLAAASNGDGMLVLGGGSTASTDSVESISPDGAARSVGRLPKPRSDLVAATIGNRTYVLGGYDGSNPDPVVLETTDGRSFTTVARLPVPVRYPAIAVSGADLYLFGGETADGQATSAIQEVVPSSGAARVVGHLPHSLDHATAATLAGGIYVLGGALNGSATDQIVSFDPSTQAVGAAGRLPIPVSNAAVAPVGPSAYLIGGTGSDGSPLSSVVRVTTRSAPAPSGSTSDATSQTTGQDQPFTGRLLIADRGNNRLLLVNPRKHVLWRYPAPGRPAPPGGFYFPDDAFFTHSGTGIISNEEENERIVQLAFPSGKVTWAYGHPGVIGSTPGYLHEPDDAYLLKDGTVTVADAQNCRVLLIRAQSRLQQIGTPDNCTHDPPHALASPNGDTPLRDGNLLVSEVNGSYIDELTREGKLVWSTHLPIAYPSDPQQIGPDRYLVADYSRPGGIYEFNRSGEILWAYHPSSGRGMLDHPSLAEQLPNGFIATNDDYRDRVVIINPHTRRIVWQYGRTDSPGTGPNHLVTPDGFDLLAPGGRTPTHPYTG